MSCNKWKNRYREMKAEMEAAGGPGAMAYAMPGGGRMHARWHEHDRPRFFKPWELVTMIVGFVVFFPVGLAMLTYVIGRNKGWWGEVNFASVAETGAGFARQATRASSGNTAFDDYRAREMERLEEERRKLDREVQAFRGFMEKLKRAKDQEEFDRFMYERMQAETAREAGEEPAAPKPEGDAPRA